MFTLITLLLATLVNASIERVEWFRSNVYFPNTSDWTLTVTNVEECLCRDKYCYFPPGWQIQPNQSVVLFVHPFSLNSKFVQQLNISEPLVNPSFSLTWRVHPDITPPFNRSKPVWPYLEFMWNDDLYPLDLSHMNATTDNFQVVNLSLSGYPLTYPLLKAGIKMETYFRTFLISELHLTSEINVTSSTVPQTSSTESSVITSLSSDIPSSPKSSSSSGESSSVNSSSKSSSNISVKSSSSIDSSSESSGLISEPTSNEGMEESTLVFLAIFLPFIGLIVLLLIIVGVAGIVHYCIEKRERGRHLHFHDNDDDL